MTSLVGMAWALADCGRVGMGTSGPVLAEVLGDEEPEEAAGGVGDGRVEPAFVDRVLGGVAGRVGHGQHDLALGAVGGRAGGRVDVGRWVLNSLTIRGLPMPPVIRVQTWPWLGLISTPTPRDAGKDDLEVALVVVPVAELTTTAAVRVEDHGGCLAGEHVGPVLARIQASPDPAGRPAQGGVDDHLAGRREFGIDDDLVGGVADEGPIAFERRVVRFDRQGIPARIDVDRAVVEGPGRSAVGGDQEADAGRARVPLAGGGDDDWSGSHCYSRGRR